MSGKLLPLRRSRRARPERRESPDVIARPGAVKPAGNASFPEKLRMLFAEEPTSVIDWLPHGEAFAIHDCDAFVAKVLPKYFRHNNLTSFQRQLNLYGFRRITKGDDKGAYRHPHFQRDRPDLMSLVSRKTRKEVPVPVAVGSPMQLSLGLPEPKAEPAGPSPRLIAAKDHKVSSPTTIARPAPGLNFVALLPYAQQVASAHHLPRMSPPPPPVAEAAPHAPNPQAMLHAPTPVARASGVLVPGYAAAAYAASHAPTGMPSSVNMAALYLKNGGHAGAMRCASRNSDLGLGGELADMGDLHELWDLNEFGDIADLDIEKVFSPPLEMGGVPPPLYT
uniref:HSF-type DNA-binding domain-containing protein n=1 Tax=Phaeomonas parva TaxID=124430 RepID=A0A7S1TT16_9STRA|mmetsp:Transcript_13459/g.39877  ORF Transcript_13459/g.39877 Transcript_13459/m.39877 type:complete len:336 (+) Transcript_13459:338-1345(+)